MSKDPAVLFYTSDFLTGTSRLTDEQCGQYIRALCSQHQEGKFSKEELHSILKSYDSPVWKKFIHGQDGLFFNERMQNEIENRISYCKSKSHKGISGRKPKSYDNHMEIIRESSGNHTENENENENTDDTENEKKHIKRSKNKLHDFKDSPFYDFEKFKEALSDWSESEQRDYYENAKNYSEAKAIKYANWIAAVKNWKRRDEKNGTGKSELRGVNTKNNRNIGRPGYDSQGNAIGAAAKPGEFEEGYITLDGVPSSRPASGISSKGFSKP